MNANQHTGPLPLADRLFDKVVDGENGCWNWTGHKTPQGYGRLNINRIPVPAHRVSYELLVGPIPPGLQIDHLCRNPQCVNPRHLEPVTIRENALRGFGLAGNNARKTHCSQGHEFSEENTTWVKDPRRQHPNRKCSTCARRWAREAYRRRQEKKAS